ncbi:MAG: hypothetical protein NZ937_08620, partial [Armatimonadetes bacterium]|nr:hypothetical protein [Armatimonadota bacterium]
MINWLLLGWLNVATKWHKIKVNGSFVRSFGLFATVVLFVISFASFGSAQQTTNWINPAGGYWDVAANWDNGVPDATKRAVISLPGTYTVTIRYDAVAAGLVLGNNDPSDTGTKTLDVQAGLTLNGNSITTSRTIFRLTGVLTGSGTLRVEGTMEWRFGGRMEGQGVTLITQGANLKIGTSGWVVTLRRTLRNEGNAVLEAGTLYLGQNGVFENKANLQLKDNTYIYLTDNMTRRTLTNKGTLSKEEGRGTAYIGIDLRNEGKVRVLAGTIQANNYYQTQTGTLEIGISGTEAAQFGKMNVTGSAWLNGTLTANLLGDFAPAVGTSFQVLTVNRRTGDFRSTDLPGDMVSEWVDRSLTLSVIGGFFVSSVQPVEISNTGTIQLTLKGTGFQQGVRVMLKKDESTFEATNVNVESIRLIRAEFNLSDIPTGDYDLVVRSPDNQEAKLAARIKVYDERVLSILAVEPNEVIQRPTLGLVTFHVRGTQFGSDVQVYLERISQNRERIEPAGIQLLNSKELQAAFDLSLNRAKIGMYHLVVNRGTNQARYPIFLFPYMAIMSDAYIRPQILVVGRVTKHTIVLTNWGNATGVGVYTLSLPSGFDLVNVEPGPGGEWGVAPDGTIVIAQPVEPEQSVYINVYVRLKWDNVAPPNQQPEPGKYRLGDKVLFKGILAASPVQELWPMVKSRGRNNWEDITAEAMIAHGAITGMYMDEFMELKVKAGHEFILRLGEKLPALANVMEYNLQVEMHAYAAAALGIDLFREQTRTVTRGEIIPSNFNWGLWDTLMLTAMYTYEDFISGKIGAISVALVEGLVEGLTLGFVQVNLAEGYATSLGYNSLQEMKEHLGILDWQISAMKVTGGLLTPNLPIGGLVSKIFNPISRKLHAMLDGKIAGKGGYVFSFGKGEGPEPVRFGVDKIQLPIYTQLVGPGAGLAFPRGVERANVWHLGYMKPNPAKGVKGGWHLGFGSIPKTVFTEKGIQYLAAGPHFYASRFFDPRVGEISYSDLIRLLTASPQIAEWMESMDNHLIEHYLANEGDRFPTGVADALGTTLVAAWDPNSIEVAPHGPYISPQQRLSFTIHFENSPEANFPAEEVTLKLVLDDDLDMNSLTFDGSSHPNVLTTAIDKETRTIIWRFVGINLPPNRNPPEGEGWAKFSVNLKQGVSSRAKVVAKAEIRFDENPPILTNEIEITVDAQPPTSQVAELPAEQSRGKFNVQWNAQDDLSGVSQSEIWFSEEREDGRQHQGNNGRMVKIEEKVYVPLAFRRSSQEFKVQVRGKFGYTYRFFAISKDAVDNLEQFPTRPQAVTKVGRAPQISQGLRIVAVPVQSEDDDPK